MDKVTLRREFCQTIALKSVLILTVCAAFAPAEPCSGEELISPTVTTVVKEVRQIADEAGAHYVAYLYDAVNERVLPIWISPDQAFSIATVLNDTPFPRPLTHDLMSALQNHGVDGILEADLGWFVFWVEFLLFFRFP